MNTTRLAQITLFATSKSTCSIRNTVCADVFVGESVGLGRPGHVVLSANGNPIGQHCTTEHSTQQPRLRRPGFVRSSVRACEVGCFRSLEPPAPHNHQAEWNPSENNAKQHDSSAKNKLNFQQMFLQRSSRTDEEKVAGAEIIHANLISVYDFHLQN